VGGLVWTSVAASDPEHRPAFAAAMRRLRRAHAAPHPHGAAGSEATADSCSRCGAPCAPADPDTGAGAGDANSNSNDGLADGLPAGPPPPALCMRCEQLQRLSVLRVGVFKVKDGADSSVVQMHRYVSHTLIRIIADQCTSHRFFCFPQGSRERGL
jgi:hypothetical protein